jgi:hypothetical protein
MTIGQIYFIVIIVFLIIILFGYQYLISIYEVDIRTDPDILYADNNSECIISCVPLNSLGWKVPFRKAKAIFQIREGEDLIEVIQLDEEKGLLRIKAGVKTGTVVIHVRPEKALLPSLVEIRILPNVV